MRKKVYPEWTLGAQQVQWYDAQDVFGQWRIIELKKISNPDWECIFKIFFLSMEIWNIMSNLNKCIFEGWFTQQTEKSCYFYEEEGQYPMMIYYCDSRLPLCFLHCVFTYWIFTFGKFQFLPLPQPLHSYWINYPKVQMNQVKLLVQNLIRFQF